MKRREREEFVERLRAIDHPDAQELADELEPPPLGHPDDLPDVRVWRKVKRALMADAFYEDAFPAELLTAQAGNGPLREKRQREFAKLARRAVGSRKNADALAAELLNSSASRVEKARRSVTTNQPKPPEGELKLMTDKQWDELVALMRIIQSGEPPTD